MAAAPVMRVALLRGDDVVGELAVGEVSVQWTVRKEAADISFSGAVAVANVVEVLDAVRRVR